MSNDAYRPYGSDGEDRQRRAQKLRERLAPENVEATRSQLENSPTARIVIPVIAGAALTGISYGGYALFRRFPKTSFGVYMFTAFTLKALEAWDKMYGEEE